jgi:CheY-like chemotaxis protein
LLSEAPVLIAEDNLYVALDLSNAVEEMDGRVIGPASTVAEALALLANHPIAAAIVDSQLADRDVSSLVRQLVERRVPFVIHTASDLPRSISLSCPLVPVLVKPLKASAVLTCLLDEIRKMQRLSPTDAEPLPST